MRTAAARSVCMRGNSAILPQMAQRIGVFFLVLALTALGGELPRASPESVGLSSERLARITRAMQDDVASGQLAGAIGSIVRKGKIAYWETVGMADRKAGKALADDDIFRIYSMTKPIIGVGLMMLYEEGRFKLTDPVKQHLPEMAGVKVLSDGQLREPRREMTAQDLMRHTAGLTYGLFGNSPVDKLYAQSGVLAGNRSIAEFMTKLGKLPLKHEPGATWDYSVSVDVQGRLIEVLSGMRLDQYLEERVFKPLDMRDTAFRVAPDKKSRFTQLYLRAKDKQSIQAAPAGRSAGYFDYQSEWFSGGGGLTSTARDYLRFAQMLLNDGELDGVRLLSRKTVALMTMDHIEGLKVGSPILRPGYGFGLDFAVHVAPTKSGLNGSVGEYNWEGLAGTLFWVDPKEEMIGLYMIQMLPPRVGDHRLKFKRLAYQAIVD